VPTNFGIFSDQQEPPLCPIVIISALKRHQVLYRRLAAVNADGLFLEIQMHSSFFLLVDSENPLILQGLRLAKLTLLFFQANLASISLARNSNRSAEFQ
jgi:hypothetical protein